MKSVILSAWPFLPSELPFVVKPGTCVRRSSTDIPLCCASERSCLGCLFFDFNCSAHPFLFHSFRISQSCHISNDVLRTQLFVKQAPVQDCSWWFKRVAFRDGTRPCIEKTGLHTVGTESPVEDFLRFSSRLLFASFAAVRPTIYTPDKLSEQPLLKISFQCAPRWSGRSSIISKRGSPGDRKSRINRTKRSPGPASLSVARMTRRPRGSFASARRISSGWLGFSAPAVLT